MRPYFSGEGGFGAGAEDEEADWGWIGAKAFDGVVGAGAGWVQGVAEGGEGFETFGREAVAFFVVVWAEFREDAGDGDGVGEEFRGLAEGAVVVDGFEFARVEEGVPVCHVDEGFFHLRAGVFEFGEEAAGAEVVVVFVDLAEGVADFHVRFVVVGPVFFGAGDGDAAVGA